MVNFMKKEKITSRCTFTGPPTQTVSYFYVKELKFPTLMPSFLVLKLNMESGKNFSRD